VAIRVWTHPMECSVTHLTWAEFDEIVSKGQTLRQPAFDAGLTEQDYANMARDDQDYHDACDHFHTDHGAGCPQTPCGDYRCCIDD
jgi:hypothetical protein